jgi:hypothetical protein
MCLLLMNMVMVISQKAQSIVNIIILSKQTLYRVISFVFLFIARFQKVRRTKEKMTVYFIRIILQTNA